MSTKKIQILDSLIPPYDETLSETSTNAVQNKVVASAVSDLNTRIDETAESVESITVDSIGAAKSDHNHDSRYYTETEIDTKVATLNSAISGKAASSHTHDNRYYTETEIDEKLSGKANSSHTHDDRYYTETEIDTMVDSINSELDGSIKSLSVSGKTITYTKNDGSTGTITTQDNNTDTKVTNTLAKTTKAYVTGTTSATTNTGTQVFDTGVYLDTTAGQLAATTFKGNLSGKATSATSADSATKATQDGNGKVISSTYETKTDASSKLTEAKTYTDTVASGKSDTTHNHDEDYDALGAANTALASAKSYTDTKTSSLASTTVVDSKISTHNTSTSAHSDIRALITSLTTKLNNFLDVDDTTTDQLSEVLTLINNNKGTLESLTTSKINVSDIVNNLTTNSTSKVLSAAQGVAIKSLIDALQTELDSHTHAIADVTGLQTALNGKAATSHGTHVSYSTTAPVMDGTASVGSASTVARSDHKHPTDTSRAAKTDLDSHTGNTTVHITSTERTNWNAAKTHADSAHAPSNAQANQNAFSYVKVGDTSVAADSATDTLTLTGSNITITPDATNDKITFAVANGSTSAKGIVQLTNSTSSTSTTTAATPNSVKSAYDLANQAKTAAATAQSTADGKANASHTHKVANITDLTATATELNYMDGVTSNVQTQLDGKSSTSHTHNLSTMINTLSTGTSTPTDADYYVCQYAGGGTTTTTYHRRPLSALWNWIKSKADSVYQAKGSYASSSHTHDDRYYTETEIDTKVSTINTAISGKAASSHTHTIANVTNLQSSLDTKQATVTGGASTITSSNLTASRALISNSSGKVAVSDVTSTELGYLDGVTSNVQTQLNGKAASSHTHTIANVTNLQSSLDAKQATVTGGASTITSSNLTANRALVSNGSGKVAVSAVTSTELGYLDGVTSNVQTQLNGKYQVYTNSIFVEGDADTYYPVAIPMRYEKDYVSHISIWKNLGSTTPSSYSGNHSNGTSSLWLTYEGRSTTWDGNGGFIKTTYKYQGYATLVASATHGVNGTQWLFVWLRGGGCSYNISTDYECSISISYSSTNYGNSTYPIMVEPVTSVDNGGIIGYMGDGWNVDNKILGYYDYGTSLPAAGIPGRIYYKKVT